VCNYNSLENGKQKILEDIRPNGKVNDWKGKKLRSLDYSDILATLAEYKKKSETVQTCANVLTFKPTESGMKLHQAWFCKSRLCALCIWRRAMLHGHQVSKIVDKAVELEPKGRWLFLTLSTRNTTNGKELGEEISAYSVALRKLFNYKELKPYVLGFMRSVEVTINKEDGTYNQHMHVLLLVKSTYFKSKATYVDQSKWRELWQKAMSTDYLPVVNVKAIKANKENDKGIAGAIREVAKYPVKDTDFLIIPKEIKHLQSKIIKDLEVGLKKKRLIAYGGLLKKIQKNFNLGNVESEDVDLVHTESEENEENIDNTELELVFQWNSEKRNYYFLEK